MVIKTLQSRLTQVGVIRLGDQLISKNGKKYPHKLDKFRFTSPSKARVEAVAAQYGGEVKPWKNTTGPEWEVYTTADDIAVLVPPQRIDPNLEHWGNGFRDRHCDGETEKLRGVPCMCAAQWGERFSDRAPVGQFCKPTTRVSLMLAEIEGLGTWKLESKGWNAAAELPMLASAIANAAFPVPARLIVDKRSGKSFDPSKPEGQQVSPKDYIVPILVFEFMTPTQAFGGQINAAARKALGAAMPDVEEQQAIASAPARTPWTPEMVVAAAREITDIPTLQGLWKAASEDGALTDEVKAMLTKRSAAIAPQPKPAPAAAAAEPEAPVEGEIEPAPDEIVDAVIVEETAPAMSGKAAWQQTLTIAGERGWNMKQVMTAFEARYGHDVRDDKTTDVELVEFLHLTQSSQVKP